MDITKENLKSREEKIEKILEDINNSTSKEVISIKATVEKASLYNSKFGGIPYIPKDDEIPKSNSGKQLKLLAQINFNEVPINNFLPTQGILQFYIEPQDDLCGVDFDNPLNQDNFRVVYYENIDTTLKEDDIKVKLVDFKEDYFPIEGEYKIEFTYGKEGISIDDYAFDKIFTEHCNKYFQDYDIEDTYDLEDDEYDLISDKIDSSGHKIGGYPFFTQEDPRGYKEFKEFDTVLLQIDSEWEDGINIMWGDSGVCNFFIDSKDLKNKDFSKVLYNWDCY